MSGFYARQKKRVRLAALQSSGGYLNQHMIASEFGRASLCFLPWITLVLLGFGQTVFAKTVLVFGSLLALPWVIFVLWQFVTVGIKFTDKTYTKVYRDNLSREYRDEGTDG